MALAALPWVLDAANRTADFLGILNRPLSAAELIQLARRRTGLADFGEPCFEAPLEVLVRSYEEEADLSPFGRMAARWDTVRFLINLLLLRDAEKRHPAILEQTIAAPLFITGLPRSGTTFLHRLLCEDAANRAVLCWETIFPLPAAGRWAGSPADRAAQVDRQLAGFARLALELPKLHPLTAHSPQECTEITAHVFRSLRFDTTHHVPSYRRWLDDEGHLAAYRFHKRFLQHLQFRKGPGQWVLKCPDHLFALDALREVYPDARIVFTHRDPLEVLQSVARLTEVLRRPFTRRVDRAEIGRQVADRWARGAAILVEAAEATGDAPARSWHVDFRRFTEDPVEAVAALYRHVGLAFDAPLAARLRRVVDQQPNGGYGRNEYRLDDYGLDAATERRRYGDYMERFGLARVSA
jgi:hypothetical protein